MDKNHQFRYYLRMTLAELNHPKFNKPLIKENQRFTKAEEAASHGGTHGAKGNFYKKSRIPGKKSKQYYLGERDSYQEYFALEIYKALGYPTPKARYLTPINGKITIATKAIPGFMPLQAYVNWWPKSRLMELNPEVVETVNTFELVPETQVVRNKITEKTAKISGNLFCIDIISALLHDHDVSGEGINIALVAENNRFRAYYIDKEAARFSKRNDYEEFSLYLRKDLSKLYNNKTTEQELAVIHSLQKLIEPNEKTGQSKLEKIFFNNRTASIYETFIPLLFNTHKPVSALNTAKACRNYLHALDNNELTTMRNSIIPFDPIQMYESVLHNAQLFINHTLENDPDALKDFEEREAIRVEIINTIQKQHPELTLKAKQIKDLLEDLRGPYYQQYSHNPSNQALIDQIYQDNWPSEPAPKPVAPDNAILQNELQNYINRIQNGNKEHIEFSHGFRFFKTTQTYNRRANYHLATQLVIQLEQADKSIEEIFASKNIKQLRQQFFETEGLVAKLTSFNFLNWGINSQQLNGIIELANTLMNKNSPTIKLS